MAQSLRNVYVEPTPDGGVDLLFPPRFKSLKVWAPFLLMVMAALLTLVLHRFGGWSWNVDMIVGYVVALLAGGVWFSLLLSTVAVRLGPEGLTYLRRFLFWTKVYRHPLGALTAFTLEREGEGPAARLQAAGRARDNRDEENPNSAREREKLVTIEAAGDLIQFGHLLTAEDRRHLAAELNERLKALRSGEVNTEGGDG